MFYLNASYIMDTVVLKNLLFVAVMGGVLTSTARARWKVNTYSQVMTMESNGSVADESLVTCGNRGRIKLLQYEYLHCAANDSCGTPLKTSLSSVAKVIIHEMCSLRKACVNAKFPPADFQSFDSTEVNVTYQCLDQFTTFIDICGNSSKQTDSSVHLIYREHSTYLYERCQCEIDSGNISLSDIRLKSASSGNCSLNKLQVSSQVFSCNATSDDYGSVFKTDGEKDTDAGTHFIMFASDPRHVEPDMVYLTIKTTNTVSVTCTSTYWNPAMTQSTRKSTPVNSLATIRATASVVTNYTSADGLTKLLTITVVFSCSGVGLIGIIALVLFVLQRWNIIRKFQRRPECDQKNINTHEQKENNLNCVQYSGCLQLKNAACECFSRGENALENYRYTPEDNAETEHGSSDYHAINDSDSPNDTVNELIKPGLSEAGNKYFHAGTIETNIDTIGYELPTSPASCCEKLFASDDLSITKHPIYQNNDFVQPTSSNIGSYLDLTATEADISLCHKTCIETYEYLPLAATGIDNRVHVQPTATGIDNRVHVQPTATGIDNRVHVHPPATGIDNRVHVHPPATERCIMPKKMKYVVFKKTPKRYENFEKGKVKASLYV